MRSGRYQWVAALRDGRPFAQGAGIENPPLIREGLVDEVDAAFQIGQKLFHDEIPSSSGRHAGTARCWNIGLTECGGQLLDCRFDH